MSTGKIDADVYGDASAAEEVDASYVVHGTAKAWAAYEMVGTAGVDDSLNVSSITDNGTGDGTLNLTNAFATTSVAKTFSGGVSGFRVTVDTLSRGTQTAGGVRGYMIDAPTGGAKDADDVSMAAHGDLA